MKLNNPINVIVFILSFI